MVNKKKVYWQVVKTWSHTLVSLFVMVVVMMLSLAIFSRFGGPKTAVAILISTAAMSITVYLLSEFLITKFMKAKRATVEEYPFFVEQVKELCKSKRMLFTPRMYVMKMKDMPNAFAFGWGFFGQYAIGITPEIYELLDKDELRGVLAHELAHIRSKDVGLMTLIVLITAGAEKFARQFMGGKTALGKGPAALILGGILYFFSRFIFPIGRSAISQERELMADALGSLYVGNHKS